MAVTDYARRIHHTPVSLLPGESRTYRLPPMTPGDLVIDATVPGIPPAPLLREHRGLPRRGVAAPLLAPAVPLVRRPHAMIGGLAGIDGGLAGIDGGDDHPIGPQPPTDLTIELLHGGRVVATSGAHILATAPSKDDAWDLRLTRRAGGTVAQTYVIEANYPSVLPIVERRIAPAAFQNAFDANWNQHQYLSMEVTPDYHLRITLDEQFRILYRLNDLDIDLGVPGIVPNMDPVKTTDIRFSMGHDVLPLDPHVVAPHQVPFVRLHVTLDIGTWIDVRFYLTDFGPLAGYLTQVDSPIIDEITRRLPGVSGRDLNRRVEAAIDGLGQARFGAGFTPWIVGEAARDLYSIRYDTALDQIVVKHIGRPPPPADDLMSMSIDPGRPPPVPDPSPRLFDTPDEVPPELPGRDPFPVPGGPRSPYVTRPGALAPIEHIVFLMQENRSFDQVLGYLRREAGRSDVDGLLPDPQSTQYNEYDGGSGNRIYRPQRVPETKWISFATPGPCHEAECVRSQMADGMKHFVSNFAKRVHDDPAKLQRVMDYFGPDQLPAYAALTRAFAICDRWFCSHIGPTWPNRFVTITGDLNRDPEGEPELNQPGLAHLTPLTATTLFDHLGDRGVSWRVYEHGYSFLRLYGRYTFDIDDIVPFVDPVRGFVADARAGRLPQVTFIEPDYIDLPPGNDDHPPGDMADGQRLIATIASALLESPQWDRTLFVITYDEAGGFYDHVWPPDGPPLAGNLRQLGPRVPAFVMSPYVAAGAVSHTVYDHTTILATILRRFCSPNPPRMSPRADAAADLRDLLLPQARPRSDFAAVHDQLIAVRGAPASPAQRAKKLAPWNDADDFHSLLAYVRSFT